MGFIFSKPNPLKEGLLEDTQEEIITKTGDILLIPTNELAVTLNDDPWQHVGIVIHVGQYPYVFIGGNLFYLNDFLKEYRHDDGIFIRQLDCHRPQHLDKTVYEYAQQISLIMKRMNIEEQYREGFVVGALLAKLNFCSSDEIQKGAIRPLHFSSETPFRRLQIRNYSENMYFC